MAVHIKIVAENREVKMFQYKSKKANSYSKMAARKNSLYRKRRGNANSRQVPDYPIQRMHIPTAMAPTSKIRYEAGAARPHNYDLPSVIIDDGRQESIINFIEDTLSKDNWRKLILCKAQDILDCWNNILPNLLERYGFKRHGGNQSCTYQRVKSTDTDRSTVKGRMSIMKRLYEGSDGIRESRVYGPDEKIKRYLRHLASALKIKFGIENEIQCYYDDNVVYVAANTQADENKILEIEGKKVLEYDAVLQKYSRIFNKANSKPYWDKFGTRLPQRMIPKKRGKAFARKPQWSIPNKRACASVKRLRHNIQCPDSLEKAKIQVIKIEEINVEIPGLHAERKILYYLRSLKGNNDMFLDPLRLGGIRRPCFICSALCFSNMDRVHPGPVWVSAAASTPKNISEMFLILDVIRNKDITTFISDNDGILTTGNDTESESGESAYDI